MKKNITSILGWILTAAAVTVANMNAKSSTSQYPALLQVQEIHADGTVSLANQHNFSWRTDIFDGDVEVGELYSCIMDDNGTPSIYDDKIVTARYTRVDMYR